MPDAALVVGIDAYSSAPLNGCVEDARDTVTWLRKIGVEPEHIRMHLGLAGAAPAHEGIEARPANRDDIWRSILEIQAWEGERLFVVLSGHGYYLPGEGPIFLTQDWSRDFSAKNLAIQSYADYFQSLKFRNVVIVVDACANYDVDPVYRSAITPSGPDNARAVPNPAHAVTLCCAASQGQLAPIVEGRGLMLRRLLEVLSEAPQTAPVRVRDAVVYDWRTGDTRLDLRPLFTRSVIEWVQDQAAKIGQVQTPKMQLRGRAESEANSFVQSVAVGATHPLKIVAEPLAGLETIKVELRPVVQELELPLPHPPPMPFEGVVPEGYRLIASCTPQPGWEAVPRIADVEKIGGEVRLDFKLRQRPPDPPRDGFNLKLISRDGGPLFEFSKDDYDHLDEQMDLTGGGDISVERHEDGPDVFLPRAPDSTAVARTASSVRKMREILLSRVGDRVPGADLMIVPPGRRREEWAPNLRLVLEPEALRKVAGFLIDEPLIRIERLNGPTQDRTVERLTPQGVAKRPWLRLEPGGYRVVFEAPWGSGSTEVEVGETPRTIEAPSANGLPPLRNRMLTLEPGRAQQVADGVFALDDEAAAVLADMDVVRPPGLPLLVSGEGGVLRAEPLSIAPYVEWDLLFGAGRLDAVHLDGALKRVAKLARDNPSGDILKLALAYAAWAQGRTALVSVFLELLGREYSDTSDAILLDLMTRDDVTREALPPPLLRWGFDLLGRHAPRSEAPARLLGPSSFALRQTETVHRDAPVGAGAHA